MHACALVMSCLATILQPENQNMPMYIQQQCHVHVRICVAGDKSVFTGACIGYASVAVVARSRSPCRTVQGVLGSMDACKQSTLSKINSSKSRCISLHVDVGSAAAVIVRWTVAWTHKNEAATVEGSTTYKLSQQGLITSAKDLWVRC